MAEEPNVSVTGTGSADAVEDQVKSANGIETTAATTAQVRTGRFFHLLNGTADSV